MATNGDGRGADGKRSHVTRGIEPTETAIVRRIFGLCAEGHGIKAIAKKLNAEGAPSPRAQQGRSQVWAPTSVREVLYRPLYRGELVWGQPLSAIGGASTIRAPAAGDGLDTERGAGAPDRHRGRVD